MEQIIKLDRWIRHSDTRHYLLIASPVVAIFLIIPFQLFHYGTEYANWSGIIPAGFVLAGFSLYVVLGITVTVLLKIRPSWAYGFSTAIFWFGVYVLLSDVFAPLQVSPLDGHPLVGHQPLTYTLVEVALFLSILFVALRVGSDWNSLIGVSTSLLLIVVSVLYGLFVVIPRHSAEASINLRSDAGIRGNVYHIVLDEFQSDAAMLHLREKNNMAAFRGFTFFTNTIANYLFTYQSFHSYMTGTLYDGVNYEAWTDHYKNGGLLKDLERNGYRITKYTPAAFDFDAFPSKHFKSEDILREEHKRNGYFIKDFVQIWLARVMPNFCTNTALAMGLDLGAKIEGYANGVSRKADVPTSVPEGIQPYSAALTLKKVVRDEVNRAPNGEYVFLHVLLPHMPYVLDDQCKYTPTSSDLPINRYYAQAGCALNLVSQYLAKIKELGRYDDATIIVQSDHGSVFGPIGKQNSKLVGSRQTEDNSGPAFLDNSLGWP